MKALINFIKEFRATLFLCVGVFLLFLLYIILIGVPRTQARNFYLMAQDALKYGTHEQYVDLMKKAVEQFPEMYITDELARRL